MSINLSMIHIDEMVKLVYLLLMMMVINGINVIIIVLIHYLNVPTLHGKYSIEHIELNFRFLLIIDKILS